MNNLRKCCPKRNFFSSRNSLSSFSTTAEAATDSTAAAKPSSYLQGDTTHFGYASVPISEKQSKVRHVFENVAESYDVMNDFMSGGVHRYWKDELLAMSGVKPMVRALRSNAFGQVSSVEGENDNTEGRLFKILDVAGGTGDVAFRFLEAAECLERTKSSGVDDISITVCDINPNMLQVGERRARKRYGSAVLDDTRALKFVEGNAQELTQFQDNEFDL